MKTKTYFELIQDGMYSGIRKTTEEPKTWKVTVAGKEHTCSNDIYTTFEKAKRALLKYHRQRISEYQMAIGWAKELTPENNLTHPTH